MTLYLHSVSLTLGGNFARRSFCLASRSATDIRTFLFDTLICSSHFTLLGLDSSSSVLQALLSVRAFSKGLEGVQHSREKCFAKRTGEIQSPSFLSPIFFDQGLCFPLPNVC